MLGVRANWLRILPVNSSAMARARGANERGFVGSRSSERLRGEFSATVRSRVRMAQFLGFDRAPDKVEATGLRLIHRGPFFFLLSDCEGTTREPPRIGRRSGCVGTAQGAN